MKIQKHIEIVRSTSPGLSSMSNTSCEALRATLRRHYANVGITIINSSDDLESIVAKAPDLVFMGMKYVPDASSGNRIWISNFLERNNIVHTGSGFAAIANERSKPLAKSRVMKHGIATAKYVVVRNSQPEALHSINLSFPLFVKPASLGGGQGVDGASLVHDLDQLNSKVESLLRIHKTDVIIEEYLPGREFSVALLKRRTSAGYISMPIELAAPNDMNGDPMLSQEIKLANQEIVLPVTDPDTHAKVTNLALLAFNALGGQDYGRIDIRLDAYETPHFLEANLVPSLISGYGSFPKACLMNIGMEYEEMVLAIVELAFDRSHAKKEKIGIGSGSAHKPQAEMTSTSINT